MWFLLIYPVFMLGLFAGCASLACRLLTTNRLGLLPALLYAAVAFIVVHGIFFVALPINVLPAALPFIVLVFWGSIFFQYWPRRDGQAGCGLEQGFFLSLLAGGFYVVVCLGLGALLFWLDGASPAGGG